MSLAETQHFCPWTGKVGKHALPIRASASMCFPNLLVAFCSLFTNSTHTHALISCKATSTGIPDPFSPPHQVSVHADTQQPEIPPPTFLWLHQAPRKQPTEMGCTSLYYIRAKTTRALTTATQPRRKVFRDVPHSLPCLSWIQALCAAKRDGHCYHTNMPTFMHQRKYFTLASCSPHDYSTRFPPLTHNHNEPHWLFD